MKANTLASSAIALGLFAVAGSQVFATLMNRPGSSPMTNQSLVVLPANHTTEVATLVSHDLTVVSGFGGNAVRDQVILTRAWSDGRIEARSFKGGTADSWLVNPAGAASRWTEIGEAAR